MKKISKFFNVKRAILLIIPIVSLVMFFGIKNVIVSKNMLVNESPQILSDGTDLTKAALDKVEPNLNNDLIDDLKDDLTDNFTDNLIDSLTDNLSDKLTDRLSDALSNLGESVLSSDDKDMPVEEAAEIVPNKPTSEMFNENNPAKKLPNLQYKCWYVNVDYSGNLEWKDKVQEYKNIVLYKFELFASYHDFKYLRVTTLGSGFNPNSGKGIIENEKRSRYFWQDSINLKMVPDENVMQIYQNSPQNVNGSNEYTTHSEVNVRANINMSSPDLQLDYKFAEEHTAMIQDFIIKNRCYGNVANWKFQMGLTNYELDDIFVKSSLKKWKINELPTLAKNTLHPRCSAVWFVPENFDGKIDLDLIVSFNYASAVCSNDSISLFSSKGNAKYYECGPYKTTVTVDFSKVTAT